MTHDNAYIRLHAGILLAGATGVFGRLISLTEVPLVWYRMVIASIVMAIVLRMSHPLTRLAGRELMKVGGSGLLLTIHWILFYASIKASNVSIAVVCIALEGFFTALLDPLINKHKMSWRELLFSMITVAGILLIFGLDTRYRFGIALGTASAFVYALFSIISKRIQDSTGHKSSTMLLYQLSSGGIFLTLIMPLYLWLNPGLQIVPQGYDWVMLPVFASVFTVTPFLFQLQALRHISAFTVNLSYNLEPIYSIILAMIIFNEASELSSSFWVGVLLVVLSVALQTFYSRKT